MTTQPVVSDADIDRIAELLIARFNAKLRERTMRLREAMLAELRAFEDLYNLPRSVPTNRERVDSGELFEKGGHVVKERQNR